jgi:hypothetical protein
MIFRHGLTASQRATWRTAAPDRTRPRRVTRASSPSARVSAPASAACQVVDVNGCGAASRTAGQALPGRSRICCTWVTCPATSRARGRPSWRSRAQVASAGSGREQCSCAVSRAISTASLSSILPKVRSSARRAHALISGCTHTNGMPRSAASCRPSASGARPARPPRSPPRQTQLRPPAQRPTPAPRAATGRPWRPDRGHPPRQRHAPIPHVAVPLKQACAIRNEPVRSPDHLGGMRGASSSPANCSQPAKPVLGCEDQEVIRRLARRMALCPSFAWVSARRLLVLQRQLDEGIAASAVVAGPGLVLASSPPV